MTTRMQYSYSILRYVHDVAAGEFINVGVALHAPEARFFVVSTRKTLGRLTETFPTIRGAAFKKMMQMVSAGFNKLTKAYQSPLELNVATQDTKSLMHSVLQHDDSSLVWSPISTGITLDPAKTLQKLYARYVGQYDRENLRHVKTDDDVWKSFRRTLEVRNISRYFSEKVIEGTDDKVTFPLAWKNGIWHCVEALSFDLKAAESMRDKAHKVIGEIASVSDSREKFKLYFVVGRPSDSQLHDAFEKAVKILQKTPVTPEIYFEDQEDLLAQKFSEQISLHGDLTNGIAVPYTENIPRLN